MCNTDANAKSLAILGIFYTSFYFPDLMGKSDLDQAKVDMICECMADCMAPVRAIFGEQDEKKKVSDTSFAFY